MSGPIPVPFPCPMCHKLTQEMKLLDDTPKGAVETVHHICPCGWDDFPEPMDTAKALADWQRKQKPKHQPPPEAEGPAQ